MTGDGTMNRLETILERMKLAQQRFGALRGDVQLVAVSKTFEAADILPLLAAGQRRFGENRVQEAGGKWPTLREQYGDVELHLIGPLQSNKVRDAVALFDVIESVDREKLAGALQKEMAQTGRHLPVYVQVNIGGEAQKAGVSVDETSAFVQLCRETYGLDVVGLMCIPPADKPPGPYFAQLAVLAEKAGVKGLSMGMSGDFETAIAMGATEVRVGSALFGDRSLPT